MPGRGERLGKLVLGWRDEEDGKALVLVSL